MARLEVLAPASPTTIDDAFMTDMRRHFTDAELVELIMLGRLHRTFGAAPMGPRSHAVLERGYGP